MNYADFVVFEIFEHEKAFIKVRLFILHCFSL